MKSNIKFFNKSKILPVDEFLKKVLYDCKFGYYSSKLPLGEKGDFVTSPKISYLFSEIIAIWIISTWESFGKPKIFNIIELGPGDGVLTKVLLRSFKKFPEFNSAKKIFLYEESEYLIKVQKKNISDKSVKWISNFNTIKKGPVVFFGNEFFDALPIKQFRKKNNHTLEKNYKIKKNYEITEVYKKPSKADLKDLRSYKTFKKLNFIELPKFGFQELKKIVKKISKLKGCILIIDYGYLHSNNQSTLQSVMKHKKNNLLDNLGKADITSHVNFSLLKEFFLKNNLKVSNVVTQKEFLENLGILERAKIVSKKMTFREQSDLYFRIKRLLSPRSMGNLFKVILAYKFNNNNFAGFK
jgi:cyclopropane-fatty-acyl-phospholipid synthase